METGPMETPGVMYKRPRRSASLVQRIGKMGLSGDLSEYEYSAGYAFNQINFTAFVISVIRVLLIVFFSNRPIEFSQVAINILPVVGCLLMMISVLVHAYEIPYFFYFLIFPLILLLIIRFSHDRGMIAFFIPYLTCPFYFLRRRWKVSAAFALAAFYLLFACFTEFLEDSSGTFVHNEVIEVFGLIGALLICFITNNSIKFQVRQYEKKILRQKQALALKNSNIRIEKEKLYETNRIKDKLFSIISHDLRIPIVSLRLLMDQKDDESGIAELITNIPELRAELQKMSRLFDDMLDWSRLQMSGSNIQFEMIDAKQVAMHVKDFVYRRACDKGIQLEIAIGNPFVYGDKDIIEIVLRNLTSNAVKFTGLGGTVKITGHKTQTMYIFQVEDNGVGIEPEILEKILCQEFYTSYGTSRESGTGLGLFICRDLLEKCQGFLSIRSIQGKGTKVIVSIPNQPEEGTVHLNGRNTRITLSR